MLACTTREHPNTPIREWIVGYALQCLVHVVLVWLEYRRQSRRESLRAARDVGNSAPSDVGNSDEDGSSGISSRSRFTKRCESLNIGVSFLWWIVGFYWVVSGGDMLLQDAPRLYWLSVVFLAFDVFFCHILCCLGVPGVGLRRRRRRCEARFAGAVPPREPVRGAPGPGGLGRGACGSGEVRSLVWRVGRKSPSYNASDSESDDLKKDYSGCAH
ncbi:unnamed protein product [Sphenostylis stenocarpa]|uniref:RING-type E3 ubiquitin transferase n=1 Tax=Sphenostylis stenocarpa TaxID=92480 RepID=A0AA86VNG7_9FABA|nr:unnamed protein product [Sphenostylis stenocarpa]